jgi:tetratricopeptide (TPR) repeat protein
MGLHQENEALRLIDEARALVPDKPRFGARWRLTALALSGDIQRARADLASLGAGVSPSLETELRARAAQLEGNYTTAIAEWKVLQQQQPAISSGYDLSLAYLGAGQAAEAERELSEFIKARPVPDLGSTSPISPIFDTRYILAHYELARAVAIEQRSQAIDYYRVPGYWGEGDVKAPESCGRAALGALAR